MKTLRNSFLITLLVAVFLKGIVFSIIVPLWEFPDEQAHFGQVQNTVETGQLFKKGNNLSEEIYLSELVLDTLRDNRGINKFTYHPDFKHTFSTSLIGPQEEALASLSVLSRTNFIKTEATNYPPLFYLLSAAGYILTSPTNLFVRVFATRMVSVLLSGAFVCLGWKLANLVFPKQKALALALALSLAFHPMLSFVSAGINNDNLLNLLGLFVVYLAASWITKGPSVKISLLLLLSSVLGLLTKPLIIPVLFGFGLVYLHEWFVTRRHFKRQLRLSWPLVAITALAIAYLLFTFAGTGRIRYWPSTNAASTTTLFDYLQAQLPRYYRETLVWYWGVFTWLGVILPLNLVRIIKVIMAISAFGLVRLFLTNKPIVPKSLVAAFIIITLSYIALLTLWDFSLVRSLGFSHGLQGRYFFPVIGAHLALLVTGFSSAFPKRFLIRAAQFLGVFMIFSHLVSLYTLAHSYYSLTNLNIFLIQASQYKPFFLKSPLALVIILTYLLTLAVLIKQSLKPKN